MLLEVQLKVKLASELLPLRLAAQVPMELPQLNKMVS
jgi:hypothetical protein